MIRVSKLEKIGRFKIRVRFSDGSEGLHDFTSLVMDAGPMIEPLKEESYFARVFLEHGALTWPNGFDIAPEWLYREMTQAQKLRPTIQAGGKPKSSAKLHYHVVPAEGGWAVKRAGATRSSDVFSRQSEAIARARDLAKKKSSVLVIYGRDGRVRDQESYSFDPAPAADKKRKSPPRSRSQKRA